MTQTAAELELQPQAEVGQVVQQLTLLEGEAQAEVFGEILEEAEPGTIALLLESLPLDERYERWNQIAFAERSAVLSLMRAEPRMSLLRQMSVEEVDLLLAQLSAEEMIEWSDYLPDSFIDRALAQMGERQRKRYELYDQYSENEIGRYTEHQPWCSVTKAGWNRRSVFSAALTWIAAKISIWWMRIIITRGQSVAMRFFARIHKPSLFRLLNRTAGYCRPIHP